MRLENNNCSIEFDEVAQKISGDDKTDKNNYPCFYTRKIRGIKNAWNELKKNWNENITMNEAERICDKYNLNTHYFCSMD